MESKLIRVSKFDLGKHKATNYKENADQMLQTYKEISARISLTMHFLHSHFEFFSENDDDVSDQHGEKFHQDFKLLKKDVKETLVLP